MGMKIGITLDEVLRSFLPTFHYVYEKYMGELEFDSGDVKSFDLLEYYDFKDKTELNSFLYEKCSLEVFGHADQSQESVFVKLNNLITDLEDETDHEFFIVSREVHRSIPATHFFLSKVSCEAKNVRFVQEYEDKWNDIDVLITANPVAIESKPEGKILVKINCPYNEGLFGDYNIDDINEILDVDIIEQMINQKQ